MTGYYRQGGAKVGLQLWVNTVYSCIIIYSYITYFSFLLIFSRFYLFIFRESRREGEKHQCVVASRVPCPGDLACSPGRYPDWESNLQPFGSQASTQSIESHQPGLYYIFFHTNNCKPAFAHTYIYVFNIILFDILLNPVPCSTY